MTPNNANVALSALWVNWQLLAKSRPEKSNTYESSPKSVSDYHSSSLCLAAALSRTTCWYAIVVLMNCEQPEARSLVQKETKQTELKHNILRTRHCLVHLKTRMHEHLLNSKSFISANNPSRLLNVSSSQQMVNLKARCVCFKGGDRHLTD